MATTKFMSIMVHARTCHYLKIELLLACTPIAGQQLPPPKLIIPSNGLMDVIGVLTLAIQAEEEDIWPKLSVAEMAQGAEMNTMT